MHDFLCSKSKLYHSWHHNPHHQRIHIGLLSLYTWTVVLLIIANILPLGVINTLAASNSWNFSGDNTRYDYDTNKISTANNNASLSNPGTTTGSNINLNPKTGLSQTGAASFSSANKEYLTIPSNSSLQTGDIDFEVGAWVNLASTPSVTKQILAKAVNVNGNSTEEYGIVHTTANKVGFVVSDGTNEGYILTASAYATGVWHFVRAWHNSVANTINIQVDNGSVDSLAWTTGVQSSTGAFQLGNGGAVSKYFDGLIDSAYFKKSMSTSGEATALYNSGAGRTYADLTDGNGLDSFKTALTSWWDMNEEEGTRYDAKGTNHLTSAAGQIIAPPVYGSELIANPGFETAGGGGADIWGSWTEAITDGTLADTTTAGEFHTGHAAKITAGASGIDSVWQNINVTAGATYYYYFWARGDGTNQGRFKIRDLTNAADILGYTNTGVTGTTYALFSGTFVAPAGCTSIRLTLYSSSVPASVVYFDDISIKQVTTAAINNGGFDTVTVTNGANILVNPGFETAGAGGADLFGTWGENAGGGTVADEGTLVHSGSHAVKLTYGTTTANVTNTIVAVPGQVYNFSFWTRGDGTNGGAYSVYDVTHSAYIAVSTPTNITGTAYTYFSGTFIAPAGCISLFLQLKSPGAGSSYFDDVDVHAVTTDFGSWTESVTGTSTVNDETASPYSGAHAARLDIDASGSLSSVLVAPITVGRKYKYTLYAKVSTAGTLLAGNDSAALNTHVLTTSYAQYVGYIVGATSTNFTLKRSGSNSNSIYIDSVTLESLGPISDAGIAAGVATDGNFAAQFSGSNYLSRTSNSSLVLSGSSWTIPFWFYANDNAVGNYPGVVGKGIPSSSGGEMIVFYSGNGLYFSARKADNSTNVTINVTNVTSNAWHFGMVGWDSSSGNMFVSVDNGTPITGAFAGGAYAGTNDFTIGRSNGSNWRGGLDGVGLIKRLLTTDEKAALYNNGRGLKYSQLPSSISGDAALKGYWNLDEKSGTRLDLTSNDNDLTDNGTVTQGHGVSYNEGIVAKITDQSGNLNNFTQATLSKRPAYDSLGINSKPAVLFDGVDDALAKTGDQIGTGDVTVVTVVKIRGAGGSGAGHILANTKFIAYFSGSKLYITSDAFATNAISGISSFNIGSSYVAAITRTSSGITNIYINGALSGSADQSSGTPVAGSDTYIGNRSDGSRAFDGFIGTTQVYGSVLDASSRNQIEKTLGASYGISVANDTSVVSAPTSIYPNLSTKSPLRYSALISISSTMAEGSTGSVRYQVSNDSTSDNSTAHWYYHNGSAWTEADKNNAYQSNTIEELSSNLQSLVTTVTPSHNFKFRSFFITDGVDNPSLTSVDMVYVSDTEPPNNPDSSLVIAKDSLGGSVSLTTDRWYNYATPSFSWTKPTDPVALEFEQSSGIAGYLVYFGTDNTQNIGLSSGLVTVGAANSAYAWQNTSTAESTGTETYTVPASPALISGQTYYLKVISVDNAGNAHYIANGEDDTSSSYNLYTYKYDTGKPNQVDYVNVSPVGCSTQANFTFSWPAASDEFSGIDSYEYKNGVNGAVRTTSDTTISLPPYRDDENVFYARSKDGANNTPDTWQSVVYCSTGGVYITDGPNVVADISKVTVSWASSKVTSSHVKIFSDEAGATLVTEKDNDELSMMHSLIVDGLKPGTDYFLQASWKDAYGNPGNSEILTLKTGRVAIIDGPSVTSGPSSLNISWVSSQQTTSYVQVYDGNTYVSEQGRTEFTLSHDVQVVGLKSEKAYRYRVIWTDQDGNIDQGDWVETNTASTPIVKSLRVDIISPTKAMLTWQTNYFSSNIMEYGIGDYNKTIDMEGKATSFSRQLDNLQAGANYQVRIKATTIDNTLFTGGDVFSTPPLPTVSNLAYQPNPDKARASYNFVWNTNTLTSSVIYYRTKGAGDFKSASSPDMVLDHNISIDNFDDQSSYEIYASGSDQYGNVAKSDTLSFDTPFDSRPPKVSNLTTEIKAQGFGSTQKAQIIVTWETDEPTSSQVEYSQGIQGTDYSFKTKEDSALSTSHAVIVSELEPSKIYHLRAVSKDKAGNAGTSSDTTTITGKSQQSVLDVIINSLQKTLGWMFGVFK